MTDTIDAEVFISPQPGFQMQFLASMADIAIGGGAAGAGKTFALLLETTRHLETNGDFGATIFRRTYPQITSEGGLWDTSKELFPLLNGRPNENELEWNFPIGSRVAFKHLQHEKNIYDWQGAQIPLLGFDELTHFSERMFFYLLSRNRSTCGIAPYVRATCNPDPDSWVARLIDWWINEDGWPIPERAGVLRYFMRDNGVMVWGDTREEVLDKMKHVVDAMPVVDRNSLVKSLTFIPGDVYHNQILLSKNPEYLGNLLAQDDATQMQLLKGNWKIKPDNERLIDYPKMLDAFTNEHVSDGKRYISADIAFHGSDLFVIMVWSGLRVIDIVTMPKSDGKVVEEKIRDVARTYSVPQSHIVYDADGSGAYLRGYMSTSYGFNNGGSPVKEQNVKVNYRNLKTQCYYRLAKMINDARIWIMPNVAEQRVNGKRVADLLTNESAAIKKHKPDSDGKLMIIPKEQMKNIIGHSPDFMDALMMRMYFELQPAAYRAPKIRLI